MSKFPIIHRDIIQGSEEWHNIRRGKLTASHATAIANKKAGLKTYIENIILNMFIEREHFENEHTKRGNELEPVARLKYEFETGNKVEEVGFVQYCDYSGFSPDGLINAKDNKNEEEDGGLEIKCRNNSKHLKLLRGGKIESSTMWQIQQSLFMSKRKWWDFVSYNKNFKQSIVIRRIFPDEEKFKEIETGLELGINLLKEALKEEVIKKEL
jgi:hypothetical protein